MPGAGVGPQSPRSSRSTRGARTYIKRTLDMWSKSGAKGGGRAVHMEVSSDVSQGQASTLLLLITLPLLLVFGC